MSKKSKVESNKKEVDTKEIDGFEHLQKNVMHIANYTNSQAKTIAKLMGDVRSLNQQLLAVQNFQTTLEARIDDIYARATLSKVRGIKLSEVHRGETKKKGST